ncbi:sensor histidine kinase [Nitrospira sp. M1]
MLIHPPQGPVDVHQVPKEQHRTDSIVLTSRPYRSKREFLWSILVLTLGGVAFSLDQTVNVGMIVGVMYALCVVFASRLSFAYAVYVAATVCSLLSLSGLSFVDVDLVGWSDVTDRLLILLAIWVAAFLSMLWDAPLVQEQGRHSKQRPSSTSTLHAEVTTSEPFAETARAPQEYGDDLAQLNQALLQKNYELETLINVVSHDLRSPLVTIQGFSKELSDSCDRLRASIGANKNVNASDVAHLLDEEIPEALQYIRAGADKITSVLSGILQFSRLGRLSLTCNPLNVNAIVHDIATVMEYQMKEKGVMLQIDDLPDCMGDETLLSQVFSNLIENAYKYLDPARPGVIRITGEIKDEKSLYTVEDNGVGILEDHQGKIFEMFHRLDPKEGSGEGLGLTIVRRIVERHQGDVWVESEFGLGTKFMVSFPSATTVQQKGYV